MLLVVVVDVLSGHTQVGTVVVVVVVVVVEVVVVDVLLGHRWGRRARFLSLTHNLAHTDNLGRSKLGVGQ